MYNGKVEGIFTDEGSYDIESQIIPFLSTLAGFKFGFNSGIRAEVLFINTKEFTLKWGTKNPITIPAAGLPGGMPIRSFGTFSCKVSDYLALIEKIAGVKRQFSIDEVRDRVLGMLDQLLMKWIAKEGKDMFNLQVNSFDISKGIKEDLDMELSKIGISITSFAISSFSYPESVMKMQEKVASQSMIGDMGKYTQVTMLDNMGKTGSSGHVAQDMASMQMGMMMGQQMVNAMGQMNMGQPNQGFSNAANQPSQQAPVTGNTTAPKFCPECGTPTNGAKFCPECGKKLI